MKLEGTTNRKPSLKSILSGMSKEELLALLLEYVEKDKQLRDNLLFRLTPRTDGILERARNLIQSSIERASRRGYVEYGNVSKATEGADQVLDMIIELLDENDIMTAVELSLILLSEMMELMDNCDDSNGEIGSIIEDALNQIDAATEDISCSDHDCDKIFDILLAHAKSVFYDGWDEWRYDILHACIPLCDQPSRRQRLEAYLLDLQSKCQRDFHSNYVVMKHIHRITHTLIEKFDGPEAAEQYIEQHLENSDFRKIAINKALAEDRLDKALQLCLDGEKVNVHYPSLVTQWRQQRYTVYEKQGDTAGQKQLARQFVEEGKFAYFIKLKELYTSEEWPAALQDLLGGLHKTRHGIYENILIHEKLKPQLMAYCRDYPTSLLRIYTHLIPEYSDELGELFLARIRYQAKISTDRRMYRGVCEIIEDYKMACGSERAAAIRNELGAEYSRRPAFLDELRNLKL